MVPETRESGRARDLLVRRAHAVRGRVTFELACHPAFDYGRVGLGFLEEAGSFMDWIQQRCEAATKERDVMIMYTIDGSANLDEQVLDHLDGYRGARPVRIGNGAVSQRQIDVYGELMDSVYLFNKERPISYDLWTALSKRLDWLDRR
jgi:GH15 family glucan-1,4-alpha-glucosidase